MPTVTYDCCGCVDQICSVCPTSPDPINVTFNGGDCGLGSVSIPLVQSTPFALWELDDLGVPGFDRVKYRVRCVPGVFRYELIVTWYVGGLPLYSVFSDAATGFEGDPTGSTCAPWVMNWNLGANFVPGEPGAPCPTSVPSSAIGTA